MYTCKGIQEHDPLSTDNIFLKGAIYNVFDTISPSIFICIKCITLVNTGSPDRNSQ